MLNAVSPLPVIVFALSPPAKFKVESFLISPPADRLPAFAVNVPLFTIFQVVVIEPVESSIVTEPEVLVNVA